MKNFGAKRSIVINCITTCFLLGGFASCVGAQGNCECYRLIRLIFMYAAIYGTYMHCTNVAVLRVQWCVACKS